MARGLNHVDGPPARSVAGRAIGAAAGVLAAWGMTAAAATGSAPKSSADPRLRSLAATCAACHGTDGAAVRGFANPTLAGLSRDYFVAQMRAFRDGTRTATVMHQIARGYSDAQILALAAYFEHQERRP